MKIEKATINDAAEILALQKLCFQSEAELCNDYSIAPLVQTLEELQKQFSDNIIIKAVENATIIGSARAYEEQGTCYIGRVMVHPSWQNRGIGKSVVTEIEQCFSAARRYELFTARKSARNLHFYQRLGYTITKTEMLHIAIEFVYFEKLNNGTEGM